jgi:GMP synthase-like glutamine amidotransferase
MDRDTEFNKTIPISLTAEGQKDPIYQGVTPRFREFHHDEVTVIKQGAVLLGSTAFSRNQSIRYSSNEGGDCLMYTSQFHPEQDDSGFHNGVDYLKNFFALAQTWWWEHE